MKAAIVVLLLALAAPVRADAPVSRGKTASASSVETPDLPASNAVDGNPKTRWSSKFFDPQWILVDLGKKFRIEKIRLVWEKAFGREYEIQISNDGKKWKRIYYTAEGKGGVETLWDLDVKARYVRYFGTARGTVFGHSLTEFEIYGN
jgi:F5/8 type C domain-containing protein